MNLSRLAHTKNQATIEQIKMNHNTPIAREASWAEQESEIRAIRQEVFVLELKVPEAIDFDGSDSDCRHALAYCGGDVVGTGRMMADGHIGRIAVLKDWRNRCVGSAILQFLLDMAKRDGLAQVYLNSQKSAIGFYEKFGFRQIGDFFIDAGIEHVRMENGSFTNH
jgi:predicted GNAT family N-acyltransferase